MKPQTHDISYLKYLSEQWKRFQSGCDVRDKVRPLIYESWMRCRKLGVSGDALAMEKLSENMLQEVLCREKELVEVASPILEKIFDEIDTQECMLALCDTKGIILKSFINSYEYANTAIPGSIMSERIMGTAGLATCLQTGSPVEIYAAEHYLSCFHDQVCLAEPIRDSSGYIRAAISISSHYKFFHKYSYPLIKLAAKSIVEQLRLRSMLSERQYLLESLDVGVISIDGSKNITGYNRRAKELLSHRDDFDIDELPQLFRSTNIWASVVNGIPFNNEEVTLPADKGRQASCTVSFTPQRNDGGILTFSAMKQMRDYAYKTAGLNAIYHFGDIIGSSLEIRELVEMAKRIATLDGSVLIFGESGTGKELFAQAIHNASSRAAKPFVAINCGALPRDLVQMELFGYSAGAFTGASKQGKPGKLELADGGTIFLDEIGEISPEAQVSLLRVLQNKEVMRIGGKTVRHLDVRVIAATNRNLTEAIKEGGFREDLYFRLSTFSLSIPPLRAHIEDISDLIAGMLMKIVNKNPKYADHYFDDDALAMFKNYKWPGNIRELEHCVERTVYLAKNAHISVGDIVLHSDINNIRIDHSTSKTIPNEDIPNDNTTLLISSLQESNGNVIRAAKLLNIGKTKMYQLLQFYRIDPKQYRKLCSN